MCKSRDCPSRRDCARHSESGTPPGVWQSWSSFHPDPQTGECERFAPLRPDEITRRDRMEEAGA